MGDMREAFDALKEYNKQKHQERVAKTPERIEYAIQQFEKHGIRYELKEPSTGHFHCWRVSDGRLYQFWAGTGKILGYDNRGIHLLISELLKEVTRKNPVEEAFEKHGIRYELKNASNGHYHCWRVSDGALFQYWCGTGKVLGYYEKGINFLISELLK